MRPLQLLLLALVALLAAPAAALQTERFLDDTIEDFSKGELTTSTLTFDGRVAAPFLRDRLTKVEASVVWDIVDFQGWHYLATGHEGQLFRQKEKGEAELVHRFDETALYTLLGARGNLYVGATPSGRVYRLGADGKPVVFAETGQQSLWSLLDSRQGVLAGTGPDGAVLSIADDGTTKTLVELPEVTNVLALAAVPGSDDVVAGTQGRGLVVRIRPDGGYTVLADPEQEEVRRVAVLADGTVIAAVNGQRSPGESFLKKNPTPDPKPAGPPAAPPTNGIKLGPASFLIRIAPDGLAEEWWAAPETPIHDIYLRPDGSALVAAGSDGHLFEVTRDGHTNRAGITDQQFVTRLAPGSRAGELLLGTGAEAILYRLDTARRGEGLFESRLQDAKVAAKWGKAWLLADVSGGAVSFSTRSGNTAKPDDSWSKWSREVAVANAQELAMDSPVGRFLQYRLRFALPAADGATTSSVDAVRLFYARPNVAPKLSELKVGVPPPPLDPKATKPAWTPSLSGKMQAPPDSAPASVEVSWKGEDVNGDYLRYSLYLAPAGSSEWTLLEAKTDQQKYTLSTNLLTEGEYRVKVVATDAVANEAGDGRTTEAISNLFLIDNREPTISVLSRQRGKSGATVKFRTQDNGSLIASAGWRADYGDWLLLNPDDGLMDQKSETFTIKTTEKTAAHARFLTVVVTDEAGNTLVENVTLDDTPGQ